MGYTLAKVTIYGVNLSYHIRATLQLRLPYMGVFPGRMIITSWRSWFSCLSCLNTGSTVSMPWSHRTKQGSRRMGIPASLPIFLSWSTKFLSLSSGRCLSWQKTTMAHMYTSIPLWNCFPLMSQTPFYKGRNMVSIGVH